MLSLSGAKISVFRASGASSLEPCLFFPLAIMGWPHVVTRHMAMTRNRQPHAPQVIYATVPGICSSCPTPYLVGILAILILPGLEDPEMAIFQVAGKLLPAAVTGLVMAAIMAAIMSTADSLLLADRLDRVTRPVRTIHQSERIGKTDGVGIARPGYLAIAVIGYLVALVEPPSSLQHRDIRDVSARQCVLASLRLCGLVAQSEHARRAGVHRGRRVGRFLLGIRRHGR